ncbi:hypothetical protein [Aggregatilinea lenta]|uniref:hypothetical protein n=1 Tax=Aggregatilinea lenta TaxID=913108 RepID=UPI000E5B977E|nr:hypothetical protein [Aggregatilinea lenta]
MQIEAESTQSTVSGRGDRLGHFIRAHRAKGVSLVLLIVLVLAGTYYVAWRTFSYSPWDHRFHVDAALEMKRYASIDVPHFLYHAFIIFLTVIGPDLSLQALATISILVTRLATAIVAYLLVLEVLPKPVTYRAGLIAAFTSIMLLIVAPITLRTWDEGRMYLGYVGINAMHNPTLLMLTPFALALAWVTARIAYSTPDRVGLRRDMWLSIVLIVLSTLAKPSYLICLLPAVGIIAGIRLLRRERLPWAALIWGIGVPSAILLAWQYIFTYGSSLGSVAISPGGIAWSPFTVMRIHAQNGTLLDKFLLSIAFPALVYGLFFPAARRDRFFTFSTLAFLFGAFYMYFLEESGRRAQDGNFLWSAQIALFIWFVAAVRFLLQRNYPTLFGSRWGDRLRSLTVLVFLGLHLFSGFVYQARGAIYITGYKLSHVAFDFKSYTPNYLFERPLYREYLQASLNWDDLPGLVWQPGLPTPVPPEVMEPISNYIKATPDLSPEDKETYFKVIYQIVYGHVYFPNFSTPEQDAAISHWNITRLPGDLVDIKIRYVIASDVWFESLSPVHQHVMLNPAFYTRMPIDDEYTLFVVTGDQHESIETLLTTPVYEAYQDYAGPVTPVLLLPEDIEVDPDTMLQMLGDRVQHTPLSANERDALFGVIKAVTEEQYLPATFDDPAQQAAFDRWAVGKLPGDLRDAGVDYLLLDQRGYVIPYFTDVQRALIFASPRYYELIGEGLGLSLYRVTGEQTLDTLGLAPDTYAALEDYQPDFDPDWSPDTLVLNPTQGALTSRADVRQVMGVYLETTDDPAEDEVSTWFDRLKVVQNLVAPDDARLSAAQQTAVTRWQTSRDPADLLDAGIGYVVFDDTWLQALPDAERATLSDPAQYAPVEDWQLDFYGEFYHLYRVLDDN